MQRMRVALVGGYPLDGVATGGAAKVCQHLASLLARRDDLDVHVFCPADQQAQDRLIDEGRLKVHAIATAGALPVAVNRYLKFSRQLPALLSALAPDIIHAQDPVLGLLATRTGIPTLMTVHGMFARELALRRGLRWWKSRVHLHLFKKALRSARYILSISPYAEQELRAFTDATFIYIPNPVSDTFFRLGQARQDPQRVLFVGNLIYRKGVLQLIKAFHRTLRTHPEAQLRLVGGAIEPGYFARIQQYVSREGLGRNVTFVGPLGEEQGLLGEYQQASILALMSRQETAPVVIGEAMAAGKAVVATRICGIPYMVDDGVTGLLAEADDVGGFAECLGRLLGDPDLARRMGEKGREKARCDYHPERVAERTVEAYRRVLAAG